MNLDFFNQTDKTIDRQLFSKLLDRLPQVISDVQEERVELLITDNLTIRKYNNTYRGKDSATDVLSFAERELPDAQRNPKSLGQIIISLERAASQADELGQSLEEELRFLFTHGLLHLLGHDHQNPADEEVMLDKAYRILGRK